jgi:hypothetical protein
LESTDVFPTGFQFSPSCSVRGLEFDTYFLPLPMIDSNVMAHVV